MPAFNVLYGDHVGQESERTPLETSDSLIRQNVTSNTPRDSEFKYEAQKDLVANDSHSNTTRAQVAASVDSRYVNKGNRR